MCLFHKQFSFRTNVCIGDADGHFDLMTKLIKLDLIQ